MRKKQPTADRQICGTCDGAGDYILYEQGRLTHDGTCDRCGGTGEIAIIRDETGVLPDLEALS